MCAVLCRLVASTRCQRRCALAVQVSGFNWALFTWQGTHRQAMRCALAVRWSSTAEPVWVCAVACCATHMINYFRSKCKLCLGTIYCAFQLKIAHFRRFEHNILWWQEKIHTSHKKLYKITAIFQTVFVLFAHNSANMRCALYCDGGCA